MHVTTRTLINIITYIIHTVWHNDSIGKMKNSVLFSSKLWLMVHGNYWLIKNVFSEDKIGRIDNVTCEFSKFVSF